MSEQQLLKEARQEAAQALDEIQILKEELDEVKAALRLKDQRLKWAIGKLASVANVVSSARDALTSGTAHYHTILLMGPNGSGKGTQGALAKRQFEGMRHIESGAIFRANISGGTDLGLEAKEYIARGDLVPDNLTFPMVMDAIRTEGAHGFLLDGYPRSLDQAKRMWDAFVEEDLTLDFVIEIQLDRSVCKERIMGRRVCGFDGNHPNNVGIPAIAPNGDRCRVCGAHTTARSDDLDEAAINKRHDIYFDAEQGTLAACKFFKKLAQRQKLTYIEMDGAGAIDHVQASLLGHLQPGMEVVMGPGLRTISRPLY